MRYYYLDVLKAFAIIAVVLYHSGFLPNGFLGVDLFLVINGYLITQSLRKRVFDVERGNSFHCYFGFEASRIIRLLPILLIAGLVCMAVGFVAMLPDDFENLSESVVATNLFGNNILAAITTKNYWDVVNEYKPLMHTWYVGVLMQFYITYPILFILAKLDKKNSSRTLLVMISILAVVSLLVYLGTSDIAHRFYYLPSRFFEFAAGGIIALAWDPKSGEKLFQDWFVYVCYALLLALFAVNLDIIPANLKLVVVVALSVVLLLSNSTLENGITANGFLAKIGAASYSIFVWHQVLLAFYRYMISSRFTVVGYALLLLVLIMISWLTYRFIEQRVGGWLKEKKSKSMLCAVTFSVFLGLTGFAGFIYLKAGVVRDVPELYIQKNDIHRGLHSEYNDRIERFDKPFVTQKKHWLIIGNSFGRDFANTILESPIADSIELSYVHAGENYRSPVYSQRFAAADVVFLSSLGVNEEMVAELEVICAANGLPVENFIIVGEKNFGETNGQFYIHRNDSKYFEQRTKVRLSFLEKNNRLKSLYGERYLDLISLLIDDNNTVPVFTPDHHYISQDCEHFSRGGAMYFSQLIDWNRFLELAH